MSLPLPSSCHRKDEASLSDIIFDERQTTLELKEKLFHFGTGGEMPNRKPVSAHLFWIKI